MAGRNARVTQEDEDEESNVDKTLYGNWFRKGRAMVRKKMRPKKERSKEYMTREVKSGPRNEKVESKTPYKSVKGSSPEIESYGLPKKGKKKARKVLGRVAR
jgi:hypothetical protein